MTIGALAIVALVFGFLSYGMFRSRWWVARVHLVITAIWLVTTLPFSISLIYDRWLKTTIEALVYVIFVYLIPVAIQTFLSFPWRRHFPPPKPIGASQIVWYVSAMIVLGIALSAAGLAFFSSQMNPDYVHQPGELSRLETERFLFTSRPSETTEAKKHQVIEVVCVDKDSWLKEERRLWISESEKPVDSVSFCWHNDGIVGIIPQPATSLIENSARDVSIDTVWVDPDSPNR